MGWRDPRPCGRDWSGGGAGARTTPRRPRRYTDCRDAAAKSRREGAAPPRRRDSGGAPAARGGEGGGRHGQQGRAPVRLGLMAGTGQGWGVGGRPVGRAGINDERRGGRACRWGCRGSTCAGKQRGPLRPRLLHGTRGEGEDLALSGGSVRERGGQASGVGGVAYARGAVPPPKTVPPSWVRNAPRHPPRPAAHRPPPPPWWNRQPIDSCWRAALTHSRRRRRRHCPFCSCSRGKTVPGAPNSGLVRRAVGASGGGDRGKGRSPPRRCPAARRGLPRGSRPPQAAASSIGSANGETAWRDAAAAGRSAAGWVRAGEGLTRTKKRSPTLPFLSLTRPPAGRPRGERRWHGAPRAGPDLRRRRSTAGGRVQGREGTQGHIRGWRRWFSVQR